MNLPSPAPTVLQRLRWGDLDQQRPAPPETMYAQTGRRLYVLGDIDGRFRPRSNPYDVHAYGGPRPEDPLAHKLQGVWAQPVKGISAYGYTLNIEGSRYPLEQAETFTQRLAEVDFEYSVGALHATRRDFAALDLPVLFSTLTLTNHGQEAIQLRLSFTVVFDLQDMWFTQVGDHRNPGQRLDIESHALVARAEAAPERWAVAVAGQRLPDGITLLANHTGQLHNDLLLAPGEPVSLTFGMWIEAEQGAPAALAGLAQALARAGVQDILDQKLALYTDLYARGPRLFTPDPLLNAAFDLARANLQMLEAEQPALGRYFYAGLEIFPYWFSNDGAYSAVGMLAAGLGETALNHARIGLRHLGEGQVPHQIAPSGRVAFAGNAPETPLWVMSLWDIYRWSGERGFLAEVLPPAAQAMFAYVLGTIDPDGDGYPSGAGMVEVEGMGPEKLDSAVYTWAALRALENMAEALGDGAIAEEARRQAERIAARFDADWWDAEGGTYAMSLLDPENARYPLPHWAVIVPLEVGLATPEHAAATFATLRAGYLNRWGLKHTAGADERVWTLPTATLSRAAYRYGEPELGFEMLRHVAETLETGSIGLFHELIPEGACIIQLWSAAVYLRGVIEDLLGIQVSAGERRLSIDPQLPPGWPAVRLEGLVFGQHRVDVEVEPGVVRVAHRAGPAPLLVQVAGQEAALAPGEASAITISSNR